MVASEPATPAQIQALLDLYGLHAVKLGKNHPYYRIMRNTRHLDAPAPGAPHADRIVIGATAPLKEWIRIIEQRHAKLLR